MTQPALGSRLLWAPALLSVALWMPAMRASGQAPATGAPAPTPAPRRPAPPAAKPPPHIKPLPVPKGPQYLHRRVTQLWLTHAQFRNVGANIPDLFERFLNGDDAGATKTLADAKAAGIRVVRCWGATWAPEGFARFLTNQSGWLAAFDRMLAAADAQGISVVPSLLFNVDMLPGYVRETTGRDERIADYVTPGSASNKLAVEYVTAVVRRFQADTRVLFWEIGNEYNLEADLSLDWKQRPANQIVSSDQIAAFLAQIARLIHSLDKHHLVTSGNADMRPAAWHMRQAMLAHHAAASPWDYKMDWEKDTLTQYIEITGVFNPPPIDIVSVHLYPPDGASHDWLEPDGNVAYLLPWVRYATDVLGKPLFVGEFGEKFYVGGKETPALWTLNYIARLAAQTDPTADTGAQISCVWDWEYDMSAPDGAPDALAPTRTPHVIAAITAANLTLTAGVLGERAGTLPH